jgi:hypothetical protein
VVTQKTFARFWNRARDGALFAVDLNRLLVHFPHRLLYENRQTRSLNGAQMRALAEDIHTLCGAHIDHFFEIWKQSGDQGPSRRIRGVARGVESSTDHSDIVRSDV